MTTGPYYVGLDVGGTSMKGGVVDDRGKPLASVSLPTESQRGQVAGLERMCETIRAAVQKSGLGHIIIEMTQPRLCGCGRRGCLEAYGSATAVVKRTVEALAQDGGASSLHGVHELTARAVFDAAATGDTLAARIVEETAYYLA